MVFFCYHVLTPAINQPYSILLILPRFPPLHYPITPPEKKARIETKFHAWNWHQTLFSAPVNNCKERQLLFVWKSVNVKYSYLMFSSPLFCVVADYWKSIYLFKTKIILSNWPVISFVTKTIHRERRSSETVWNLDRLKQMKFWVDNA